MVATATAAGALAGAPADPGSWRQHVCPCAASSAQCNELLPLLGMFAHGVLATYNGNVDNDVSLQHREFLIINREFPHHST